MASQKAIIVSIKEYEGWLETLKIMSDPKLMRDIKEAEKEIATGKLCPLEEVLKDKRKRRK